MPLCTRSLTLSLAAAMLLAGAGCSFSNVDDGRKNLREILQDNRAKWVDQGIDDYVYTYTRLGRSGEVAVTVRADTIVQVTIGEAPAPEGIESEFLTVEKFFDLVEEAIEADKEDFDAGFDRTRGYPALLVVDYDRSQGGLDELIQVTAFEPLGGDDDGDEGNAAASRPSIPPTR